MSVVEERYVETHHSDEAVALAHQTVDSTPFSERPYGIYVDGGLVSLGKTKDGSEKAAVWWKQTFPGPRRVTVRQRETDDRVWREA